MSCGSGRQSHGPRSPGSQASQGQWLPPALSNLSLTMLWWSLREVVHKFKAQRGAGSLHKPSSTAPWPVWASVA